MAQQRVIFPQVTAAMKGLEARNDRCSNIQPIKGIKGSNRYGKMLNFHPLRIVYNFIVACI